MKRFEAIILIELGAKASRLQTGIFTQECPSRDRIGLTTNSHLMKKASCSSFRSGQISGSNTERWLSAVALRILLR